MLTFGLKRSSTKGTRTYKKFPRQKLNGVDRRELKGIGFCKHNWHDDDYTYIAGNIKKFLMSNIGKPMDKVFSKFLSRCKKLGRFNPKQELYDFIKKKEDIVDWIGGFYLTNGILNYKKPIKRKAVIDIGAINKERFDKLDLHNLLKTLHEIGVPQCLGKFWVSGKERTIYMDYRPCYYDIQESMPSKYHNKECAISGVGYGININIEYSQTGKIKYTWYIETNFIHKPLIYFYYKK